MPGNELWEGGVEAGGENVVGWVVEGHRVSFVVSRLAGEGEPVRDVVASAFEVLGAEALT